MGKSARPRESNRHFLTELGRAFGGAVLFARPIMTMVDAFAAVAVGFVASAAALLLFSVIE